MSTALLRLPERRHRGEHPFWHRPAPAVAVVRLDPGFAALRSELSRAWEPLVRVKYVLDALMAVARTPGIRPGCTDGRFLPLLDALAKDLHEVAHRAPDALLARQAAVAAGSAQEYSRTGVWPVTDLERPRPGELWMHCGPLRPWAMQASPQPLALLVGRPEPVAQRWIDRVTTARVSLEDAAGRALGARIRTYAAMPDMVAVDLLLVGGTADSGHKNFAHFFPLESPAGRTTGRDFTVVFANVHLERLTRCSLHLLKALGGPEVAVEPGEMARASFGWFRGHDMAHFWTTGGAAEAQGDGPRSFETMVLQEALADALGVLALADFEDPAALGAAFSSEMLRYLSRNHNEFADTTAAALEVGWLTTGSDLPWDDSGHWLESALPSMAGLARAIRAALDGSTAVLPDLRAALGAGRHLVAEWYGPLAGLPTDLEYSFG